MDYVLRSSGGLAARAVASRASTSMCVAARSSSLSAGAPVCSLNLASTILHAYSHLGATSSVMLVFVLPATIYLRCVPADGRSRCTAAAARALLVLGVAVAALAIGAFVVTQTGAGG